MEVIAQAAAVIVAAGQGQRSGAPDKILLPLNGKPLLTYALDAVEAAPSVTSVVLVVGQHTIERAEHLVQLGAWTKITAITIGGERRQDSVAAGLASLPASVDIVALHDAARPFAPPALFDATISAARHAGAAITAVPVTDTIKRVQAGRVVTTVPRTDLWAAQTPQAFNVARLREALAFAAQSDLQVTDEASLFEAMGWPVEIVPGTSDNLKITYPADLDLAAALLQLQGGPRQGAHR